MFSKPNIKIATLGDVKALENIAIEDLALPQSTYELIRISAEAYPDKIALRYLPEASLDEESITYTYRDLCEKVTQAANALYSLGVRESDSVSMLLPNLPQTHFSMWGAEAAGIFNPINPLLEVEHIAAILNEANTRVVISSGPASDPELWKKVMAAQKLAPCVEYVLAVESSEASTGDQYLNDSVKDFDQMLAAQPADALLSGRIIQGTDIASYFHTGGTTGTPKLAPHTHFNEIISTYQIAMALDADENSVGLCGLPLFHVNAVFVTGLAPWLVGGEAILATAAGYRSPAVIKNFWGLVQKYRISYFSAVPTIISALMDVPSEEFDVSSLDAAFCGAAPLATELIRKFESKTGLVLVEGYGQTEGTTATTVNPKFGDRRIGSVGLPLPYCKVRIVEIDASGKATRDCDVNEPGVIAINGPNVFSGYKQAHQNEGQWVNDGWFNTGDLGRLDADGYLWLTGRSKDLIIRGGHNIDPQMIEETYYKHEKVAEAVALGKPDKRVGELPIIVIQLKKGMNSTAEEMIAYGQANIHERAAVPKEVHFVDAVPLTAVGKIFKPELRNTLIQQQISAELAELLDEPLMVDVAIDKKFGQCVTVTSPAGTHTTISNALGDYAFKLVLRKT